MIGREGGLGGRSKTFFGFLKKKANRKKVEKMHRRIKIKLFSKSRLVIASIFAQREDEGDETEEPLKISEGELMEI